MRLPTLAAVLLAGCVAVPEIPGDLDGTWGGDNAGLIVTDSTMHVHIGCTLGTAPLPIHIDAAGHFEVTGTYNVDAFPVDQGIIHPAIFRGDIDRRTMVLTVTLTDTARTIGPVSLTYGTEPRMQQCPICRPRPSGMPAR